ncbi:acyltransferase [Cryobacterium algoricola]|uniref:Acyltransferase n=1 Tax=Cryobacterium algoricola TaxID=1259183 RepID=A0ABY2IBA7_9MICO|nr:acyltransferase [Cryobacterium algoricola]TFB86851.1 acyltransferase [Cryobacterium algoricola]
MYANATVRLPGRLPSLTGLRWVAALVIFAYHTRNVIHFPASGHAVLTLVFGAGPTAVSLFFILSGFVLAWSHDSRTTARKFWTRRAASIAPVHLAALALALALAATLIPSIRTEDPWAILANGFLVNSWNPHWWQAGNPVSWSLACEAFFYVAFPVLIRIMRRFGPVQLWGVLALQVGIVFAIPTFHDQLPLIISANSSPLGRLPEFIIGVTLGLMIKTEVWRGPRLRVGVTAAVSGYLIATLAPDTAYTNAADTVIGFALLISASARCDVEGRHSPLGSRTMTRLGTLSFAFYLIHVLALQSISSLFPEQLPESSSFVGVVLAAAAFAVSLAGAELLNRVVERPARQLILRRKRATPSESDVSPSRRPVLWTWKQDERRDTGTGTGTGTGTTQTLQARR